MDIYEQEPKIQYDIKAVGPSLKKKKKKSAVQ